MLSPRFLIAACSMLMLIAGPGGAATTSNSNETQKSAKATPADKTKEESCSPWYFFSGNTNNHPRLKTADALVRHQIDAPFSLISPDFNSVRTFSDQANEFMIWSPLIGIGRLLNNHFDLFLQTGYAAGVVRTRQTHPSMLLLPFHSDIRIYRSSFFIGPGLAYFPFGVAELRKYHGIKERLCAARPYVVQTMHWNNMTYKAKVKAGFRPFNDFIKQEQQDAWSPFSTGTGLGVDIPVTRRSVFSANIQYNFFFHQADDFSGPGISFLYKTHF
jgi:hypothetical protein